MRLRLPALMLHLAHACSFALQSAVRMPTSAINVRMEAAKSQLEPVEFSPLVALRAAISSNSFGEFMAEIRSKQGDALMVDLWPFAPKTYLLMGKEANRDVLSSLDSGLEQILQELINLLPISAKVPSEVDVELQRKVASLFQSEKIVNQRLPSFSASAVQMKQRWASMPAGSGLDIFCELSEYVLLADLEVICARAHRSSPTSRQQTPCAVLY